VISLYLIYAARISGHAGGRALLRHALAQAGLSPDLEPERLPGGKPFLTQLPFNLSHSGNWSVCAVSDNPVGVDLELERPLRAPVEKKLTQTEQAELLALPPNLRTAAFFDLWVLKEAALKQTGQGLSALSQIEVSRAPVSVSLPGLHATLLPFPEEGYHLALCGASPNPEQAKILIYHNSNICTR
jgi:4'-phosphopantetheinyl transferase